MDAINSDKPEFQQNSCKKVERENILGFLRFHNPSGRFNKAALKKLSQIIHNLKRNEEIQFSVGQGHTAESTLKNKLVESGLMEWTPGYHVKDTACKYSTIRPTPLFGAVVNRCCQINKKGYWADPQTLNELIWFNGFMSEHRVTYARGEIDPISRFYYLPRLDGTGIIRQRLINQVHGIKKHVRSTIKIDDEDTVNFDVTATHPQLLINLYGKQSMLHDPYDIAAGHDEQSLIRDAAKLATMMMLNTSNRKSAGAAFRKELRKLKNENIKHAIDRYTESQISILDQVLERNPVLQPHFYRSAYQELHHIEATIAWNCMMRLAEQGIPSLTVHDEVIIKKPDLEIALDTYRKCWAEGAGTSGLGIELKLEIEGNDNAEELPNRAC